MSTEHVSYESTIPGRPITPALELVATPEPAVVVETPTYMGASIMRLLGTNPNGLPLIIDRPGGL